MKNKKDGYHLNWKYWQDKKKLIKNLSLELEEVAFGMILGNSSMSKKSREAIIKFEQGYKQIEFLVHLFILFKKYTFMEIPNKRIHNNKIKSYWFKTFSHVSFTKIYDLCYLNNKKVIYRSTLSKYLTPRSLAYWIMCDGSLNGKTIILHTQGFSESECYILSNVLKEKFNLWSIVIPHKKKYFVIRINSKNFYVLRQLIEPFIIPSMLYKIAL